MKDRIGCLRNTENETERLNTVRKIQLLQIELIRIYADICQKEGLSYYMYSGTMLGAVRHKGYIPWDDDADFAMPRPDYDRFLEVAGKYMCGHYSFATHKNTEGHLYYFTRLYNDQAKLSVATAEKVRIENVWVDIYPLDGMPNNPVLRRLHYVRLMYRKALFQLAHFEVVNVVRYRKAWYERALLQLGKRIPFDRILSRDKEFDKLDRAARRCPYEDSDYVLDIIGQYRLRELFPKSVYGEGRLYEFEGMCLWGPQDYDTYLTQLYGDYMTPSPVSERNKHQSVLITPETGGGGNRQALVFLIFSAYKVRMTSFLERRAFA